MFKIIHIKHSVVFCTFFLLVHLFLPCLSDAQIKGQAIQKELQNKIESYIATNKALKNANVSVTAVTQSGEVLLDINSDKLMNCASNLKLLTTGAALHKLGSDFRFPTTLACSGEVENGVLKGNLYIKGGGDPCLGSIDSVSCPVSETFSVWYSMLKDAGIERIEGDIVGDGRQFEGMREHQTWQWDDIGTYFAPGSSALSFCENTLRFSVKPGANVGNKVIIRQLYPFCPGLNIEYDCCTGEKDTGDKLYLYTTDFSRTAVLRGTYAVNKAPKTLVCANKFPELTCASEFKKYLSVRGIEAGSASFLTGNISDSFPEDSLHVLSSTYSPSLSRIARFTNYDSNNLFAESIFRAMGKKLGASAAYDKSAEVLLNVISEMGITAANGEKIVDGSGLSRHNLLTASFICSFLGAMMDSPEWESFYESIPVVSRNGTVKNCLRQLAPEKRVCVRMKSGSMTGVRCYSGYYNSGSGLVAFSVLVNNSSADAAVLRLSAENIIAQIAESL